MPVMRTSLSLAAVVLLFSCSPEVGVEADAGDVGAGGGTATGGGTGTAVTFCDVQPVLQAKCGSCHGASPVAGAPTIMTNADLHASSTRGGTLLDRSIIRLSITPVATAMPPNLGGTPDDIQLFTNFRADGLPDCGGTGGGAGGGGAGGGAGGGGGVAMTTCAGSTWAYGNNLGIRMNPGEACQSCHQSRRRGPLAGFMGTVYPSAHEAPLCMVTSVPSGLSVEILDSTGAVRRSFPISALNDGNFYGGSVGTPSPYTARVVVNGVVRSVMVTPQTSGDCNVCHTAQGTQGAPGRIHW
jgi:hypothetical protein